MLTVTLPQLDQVFPGQITTLDELSSTKAPARKTVYLVHTQDEHFANLCISRFEVVKVLYDVDTHTNVVYGFLWDHTKKCYVSYNIDARFDFEDQRGHLWRFFRSKAQARSYAVFARLCDFCRDVIDRTKPKKLTPDRTPSDSQ